MHYTVGLQSTRAVMQPFARLTLHHVPSFWPCRTTSAARLAALRATRRPPSCWSLGLPPALTQPCALRSCAMTWLTRGS